MRPSACSACSSCAAHHSRSSVAVSSNKLSRLNVPRRNFRPESQVSTSLERDIIGFFFRLSVRLFVSYPKTNFIHREFKSLINMRFNRLPVVTIIQHTSFGMCLRMTIGIGRAFASPSKLFLTQTKNKNILFFNVGFLIILKGLGFLCTVRLDAF